MRRRNLRRDPEEKFIKFIYVKNDAFWYNLSQGLEGTEKVYLNTKEYYSNLEKLLSQHSYALKLYAIVTAVSALHIFGIISRYSTFGIEIDPTKINLFTIPLISVISLYIASINSKKFPLESVFRGLYLNADCYQRADLLLKFPGAFPFYKYRLDFSLMPKYILPKAGILEALVFAFFVVAGGISLVAFNTGVYLYCCVELWRTSGDSAVLAKFIVITSTSSILATYLVPSAAFVKRKYVHYGPANVLNSLHVNRPERWRHFITKFAGK